MKAVNVIKDYLVITLGIFIAAVAVYFFLVPSGVTVGSASGFGVVLSYFIPLPLSAITFIINLVLLIVGFTFFYTYATFNPAEVSNNIKKNGGFVPGIRAGKPTTEYLSSIISKLTWFGGLFLAVIAILPMMLSFTGLNITFGGTSILIVVGVVLETIDKLVFNERG